MFCLLLGIFRRRKRNKERNSIHPVRAISKNEVLPDPTRSEAVVHIAEAETEADVFQPQQPSLSSQLLAPPSFSAGDTSYGLTRSQELTHQLMSLSLEETASKALTEFSAEIVPRVRPPAITVSAAHGNTLSQTANSVASDTAVSKEQSFSSDTVVSEERSCTSDTAVSEERSCTLQAEDLFYRKEVFVFLAILSCSNNAAIFIVSII